MIKEIEKQSRGVLTTRIKEKSMELFGREITRSEFRLMPYIQYTLVNTQKLNIQQLNQEEKDILVQWVKDGFIEDGVTECGRPMMSERVCLKITKEFWDAINELLWLGYADLTH